MSAAVGAAGLISGHGVVDSAASGLVVRDVFRVSAGVDVTEVSKLRDIRLADEKEAMLLLRLGTSTLLTW